MIESFESLKKADLHRMADQLLKDDAAGIESCVSFFEATTQGLWHNRARAMMARRFKHCGLTDAQRQRLTSCILARLAQGEATEQFRDQLNLGLCLDAPRFFGAATLLLNDRRKYVRELAEWILNHKMDS
jgi:hypothetical protein